LPEAPKKEEADFYHELDQKTEKKSCCTSYTLIIFFVLIFGILAILLIMVIRDFNTSKLNLPAASSNTNVISQIDFSQKEPTLEVTVTSGDLTALLQNVDSGLSNPQAQINPAQIIVTADYQSFVKIPITIKILPKVSNDKVYFSILQIKSWKFSLPGILKSNLEKSFNAVMEQNFAPLYTNYKVSDIQLEQNQMLIFGQLK
jgi:hypothetical protein